MLHEDICWTILYMFHDQDFSVKEIARCVRTRKHKIHECTVRRVLERFDEAGQVAGTSRKNMGRPTTGHIDVRHRPALYQILHHDPWLYVDEIVKRVNEHPTVYGERNYNENHVMRQLSVDGFSLKKMRKFASERDEAERNLYWRQMVELVIFPGQLVFIDETSKDGRTLRRSHGRSLRGAEIVQEETIMRGRRISVLGVFTTIGFIDFHYVDRGYSAEEFLYAVRYHVVPHLNAYPAANSILVPRLYRCSHQATVP